MRALDETEPTKALRQSSIQVLYYCRQSRLINDIVLDSVKLSVALNPCKLSVAGKVLVTLRDLGLKSSHGNCRGF